MLRRYVVVSLHKGQCSLFVNILVTHAWLNSTSYLWHDKDGDYGALVTMKICQLSLTGLYFQALYWLVRSRAYLHESIRGLDTVEFCFQNGILHRVVAGRRDVGDGAHALRRQHDLVLRDL